MQIKSTNNCECFQRDLETVSNWCNTYHYSTRGRKMLYPTSTCYMVETAWLFYKWHDLTNRWSSRAPVVSQCQRLYLRINTSSICAEARHTMGLIRRSFGYKLPAAVETACNIPLRPSLEYCCAVWNPYSGFSVEHKGSRLFRPRKFPL